MICVCGQVERVAPAIPDHDLIVYHRYFAWWKEATGGLEILRDGIERQQALSSCSTPFSPLQIQIAEQDRLRKKQLHEDEATDEHLRILQEEEEEAHVLDVRAEDVERGHSFSNAVKAGPSQ